MRYNLDNPLNPVTGVNQTGDFGVTRNLEVGGRVDVSGNAEFEKNVRILGRLTANDVEVCNKGLFPNVALLEQFYPNPKIGWYALVSGAGTAFPANVYWAVPGSDDNAVWVDSGKTSGSVVIDNTTLEGSLNSTLEQMLNSGSLTTYTLDLTGATTDAYIQLGQRGFTAEFIAAMALDAPRLFSVQVKQGSMATKCTYAGFFAPYGQAGGNVQLITLNNQRTQLIQLTQDTNEIEVQIHDLLDERDDATEQQITDILNDLN